MKQYSKGHIGILILMLLLALHHPAQAQPDKAATQADTVVMTTPQKDQVFTAGDTITVTLVPSPGTTISNAIVGVTAAEGGIGADMGEALLTKAPYVAQIIIPQAVFGPFDVTAVINDNRNQSLELQRSIMVQIKAELKSLLISSDSMDGWNRPVTMGGIGEPEQLVVNGVYSDGIDRTITDFETQYMSHDVSVATVSNTGLITAVKNGTTQVTVKNGACVVTIPVTIRLQTPQLWALGPTGVRAGQSATIDIGGRYLDGATRVMFLTPEGAPDKNIVASGIRVSDSGRDLMARIKVGANCPPGSYTIVVTTPVGSGESTRMFADTRLRVLPTRNVFSLDYDTVTGGGLTLGTLVLTAPTPNGSNTLTPVSLSSSDPSVTFPDVVSITPGNAEALIQIQTSKVKKPTKVKITAICDGASASAILTLLP